MTTLILNADLDVIIVDTTSDGNVTITTPDDRQEGNPDYARQFAQALRDRYGDEAEAIYVAVERAADEAAAWRRKHDRYFGLPDA